jgi:hypothetical protein
MGLRVLGGASTQAQDVTQMDALWPKLAYLWLQNAIPGQTAKLAWMKYNAIGVDGKYARSTTNRHDWVTPIAGGGSVSNVVPNQVCLVMTLETAVARGLANAGRIYWPLPGQAPLAADGLLPVTAQTAAATAGKAFIEGLNEVITNGAIGVASKVREGAQHSVTGVSVGRVLDTMRSRRTSLVEANVLVPIATPGGFSGGGGPF